MPRQRNKSIMFTRNVIRPRLFFQAMFNATHPQYSFAVTPRDMLEEEISTGYLVHDGGIRLCLILLGRIVMEGQPVHSILFHHMHLASPLLFGVRLEQHGHSPGWIRLQNIILESG